MKDIHDKLRQLNYRLKQARVGVSINLRGNRLYLRATLPPKPGSERTSPYQQEISLGIYANQEGIKKVEAEAKKVGALLACREFSWEPYLRFEAPPEEKNIEELILEFEKDYFSKRVQTPTSESTFRGDYLKSYKLLPKNKTLTSGLVKETIMGTKPDTRTRKRTCIALNALCRFAGVELDFNIREFQGNYSPRSVNPKSIPKDDELRFWGEFISNPYWRWAYFMLFCYGLRNHELWLIDLDRFKTDRGAALYVGGGKTGPRFVYPLPQSGVEEYDLLNILLPRVSGKDHSTLGHRMTEYFRRLGIPFSPYTLRHAFARRCYEAGLDIDLTAKIMGNSIAVCSSSYRAFWGEEVYRKRYLSSLSTYDQQNMNKDDG